MEASIKTSKRAFDFGRNTSWVADPQQLCIIGGNEHLLGEQGGELDTHEDKTHALYDERLRIKLDETDIANVDAFGILVPIVIAKLDGVATVVEGRQRVRWARVVNRRRAKLGTAPITVPCAVFRGDKASLMGAMIAANEIRVNDEPPIKIAKLKRYIALGVTLEDAATTFGLPVGQAKSWLAFDASAIPKLKSAVVSGKLTITAAIEISRLKDPELQASALDDVTSGPESNGKGKGRVSVRGARAAANKAKKPAGNEGVGRGEARKLLETVSAMNHPQASPGTLAWWEGVEDTLRFLLGADGEIDARLVKALAAARGDK